MLRTAPYPCLLLTVLILGCARHRGEMSESGALQCQSDCEVDVRNPTAEGMQVWAHVIDSHSTFDPVTLLLGTFSRGESTSIPVPAG